MKVRYEGVSRGDSQLHVRHVSYLYRSVESGEWGGALHVVAKRARAGRLRGQERGVAECILLCTGVQGARCV